MKLVKLRKYKQINFQKFSTHGYNFDTMSVHLYQELINLVT